MSKHLYTNIQLFVIVKKRKPTHLPPDEWETWSVHTAEYYSAKHLPALNFLKKPDEIGVTTPILQRRQLRLRKLNSLSRRLS